MGRNSGDAPGDEAADSKLALARIYTKLEFALVRAATSVLSGAGLPEGAPLISAETAVKLLTLRNAARAQAAEEDRPPPPDPAQLREMIAARVAAVRDDGAAEPPTAPE
ncbi:MULTISPECIES: hypothetical protein [Sphingomonas]|uniref:hypothetical protein n=1 Tax=Sphingomonas TaxID=13687 RepID=UPI000DEF9091|nr:MULTISPECIES: hypothetical protein [Sphingomonas]